MTEQGYTLVEMILALVVLSLIGVATSSFLLQTLTARDVSEAKGQATEQARLVIERMTSSIKQAFYIEVEGGGTVLKLRNNTLCETYSLSGARLYYDSSPTEVACPVEPTTSTSLIADATVTNLNLPVVTLFEALPAANPVSVKIRLRLKVVKPLADSQILVEQSVTRRQ